MWKLMKDGKELKVGDIVTNFRGEKETIKGLLPPHKMGACGKYYTEEYGACYYVSCIGAKFVEEN